jgi:hypothetical protein
MIKIKIFCSFAPSDKCKETFERINYSSNIDFYGEDKKYYFTNDDDFTHAIIMNTAMPELKIPKENVIGLAFEPIYFLNLTHEFIEYAKNHIGRYFIGDKFHLPNPFIEHFAYMWHSRPLNEITYKNKIMSIIVSEKQFAPGHFYRHQLVQKIIELNTPIDIYGRGANKYSYGNRIMGTFDDVEPYETYLYSICIENTVCNHYFSEKIMTPLMYNCMPIYHGCKNIDNYVENIVKLEGNIDKDILTILSIINNPNKYYKKTYTEKNIKAVNLIENLPNIFPLF